MVVSELTLGDNRGGGRRGWCRLLSDEPFDSYESVTGKQVAGTPNSIHGLRIGREQVGEREKLPMIKKTYNCSCSPKVSPL